MNQKNRNNIIAAVIALLIVGILVICVAYFVRLQNENREKNLKITPTFTGPPEKLN